MQACKNQGPNSVKKTLTPTQIFLVCSGRSAKQHSCRPLFSLHSDTSGGGHQSFFALALHCVLYTPKTKHHTEDKENAWTHREQNMWVEIETSFFTVLHRHLCELGFYSVPLSHCPVNKRLFGCTFLQKRSKSQELKKEIQSVMVQLFRLFFLIVQKTLNTVNRYLICQEMLLFMLWIVNSQLLNDLDPYQLQSTQLIVHAADRTVELLVNIFHLVRNTVRHFKTSNDCRVPCKGF